MVRVGSKTVVEIQGDIGILLEEVECQIEIIIEAVGCHTRLFPVACLVHLEGRSEVLCITDHRDGDISYKDTSLQRRFLVCV